MIIDDRLHFVGESQSGDVLSPLSLTRGRSMDIQSLLDSIPAPTEAEMLERRNLARKYTMVLLRDGPASRDDEERNVRIHTAHLQHLTKLQISGKLVINGPVMEEGHGIQGF